MWRYRRNSRDHHDDTLALVLLARQNGPSEPRVEAGGRFRVQVEATDAEAPGFLFTSASESGSDPSSPVLRPDPQRRQPRRELRPAVHVAFDEAHRADRLAVDERYPRACDPLLSRVGCVTADPEVERLSFIPSVMPLGDHPDEVRVLGERIDRDDPDRKSTR